MGAIAMTEAKDQTLEAIAKLISLTRDDKIRWSPISPGKLLDKYPGSKFDIVFSATYNDRVLRIYRHSYEKMISLAEAVVFQKLGPMWCSEITMDISDNHGNSIWEFPRENIINDLYNTIKYKVSGANTFITELLAS